MFIASRFWLIAAIVAVGLLGRPAVAAAPHVADEAGLFSPDAVAKADKAVKELQRQYHTQIVIETVAKIPAEFQTKLKEEGKEKFFRDWAAQRAQSEADKGIYILICKEPGHVEALVDRASRQKVFTFSDRDRLVRTMLEAFRDKKFDTGLLEGVQLIADTVRANGGQPAPTTQPAHSAPVPTNDGRGQSGQGSMMGWVCLGVAVLGGLWLVFAAVRALTGASRSPPAGYGPPGGYPQGAGGGGFMTSILGGLFGAAAGSWLYDSFFRGHGNSQAFGGTPGAGPDPNGGAGDFGGDQGRGGDFGGDTTGGGGGDFGGGGTGGDGGDFGGGDTSGGTGGGGGGDF